MIGNTDYAKQISERLISLSKSYPGILHDCCLLSCIIDGYIAKVELTPTADLVQKLSAQVEKAEMFMKKKAS